MDDLTPWSFWHGFWIGMGVCSLPFMWLTIWLDKNARGWKKLYYMACKEYVLKTYKDVEGNNEQPTI